MPARRRSRLRSGWSRSRSPLPYLLRGRAATLSFLAVLSAGFGYAWTAIASKLLTDELAAGTLLVAVAWLATALASEGLALLSEMSALQRRPATHVAPVMFAVQVLVPVILAPLIFEEKWSTTPLERRRPGRFHGRGPGRHHAAGGLPGGRRRDRVGTRGRLNSSGSGIWSACAGSLAPAFGE